MRKNFIYSLLSYIVSPPICCYCKKAVSAQEILCVSCVTQIKRVISLPLPITSLTSISVIAVSRYVDPLKQMILAKGWSDRTAARNLGEIIWNHCMVSVCSCDIIVPVPLHWTRYAYRGFNQAEEIARILSQRSGKPLANLVKRVRRTPFQSMQSAVHRQENVKQAFVLRAQSDKYCGKKILIVDDVLTSGATMRAVAKELLKLKPTHLIGVVACRVQ